VVFFQGCAYRCLYCHNPDTWNPAGGRDVTLDALLTEVRGAAPFIKRKGGVTASGGEPLRQARFLAPFFQQLQREGFHTALDTAGMINTPEAYAVLDHTDLVLMDLKGLDDALHRRMTGHGLEEPRRFLRELADRRIPTWFRVVLVPGYTDGEVNLRRIAELVAGFPSAEKLELLPFHQMGAFKWDALRLPYALSDVPEPTEAELVRARRLLGLETV